MGDAKNTIEINGKLYNATTGQLIGQTASPKKVVPGAIMDGVVRKPQKTPHATRDHKHPVQSSAHHKRVNSSKTLVRSGLKKPALKQEAAAAQKKLHHQEILGNRLKRAHSIEKSNKISRFGKPSGIFSKHSTELPVHHPRKAAGHTPAAVKATEAKIEHFEKAVSDATSHLTKYADKEKKRFLKSRKANIAAGTLAVFLLIGFFGFQNAPSLRMRIASTDAGFSAKLPGYQPAGFGVSNSIQSEPGKVTVSFKSRTDDRGFNITQSASNWSSESLGNELATKNNKQTWQEQGKTVYTYDNSNAAWVDGGVLYQIEGNAELSSDQLRRIVNSF